MTFRPEVRVEPGVDPAMGVELQARLEGWQPDLVGTLLFVVQDERVLLIHKRRGHGAGRVNAPGGKLEPGETPLACALRETVEETGVVALGATLRAEMRFIDRAGPDWLGYVFVASRSRGAAVTTPEAVPFWVALDEVPYHRMWPDDRLWLPSVLAGETLRGDFLFENGVLLASRVTPGRLDPRGLTAQRS
ncbi:MAG: 8-oxo-dGTP diphosphatase [Pseudomonadales bacterium]|jgi:8-oxo-dGTP diphosphatase